MVKSKNYESHALQNSIKQREGKTRGSVSYSYKSCVSSMTRQRRPHWTITTSTADKSRPLHLHWMIAQKQFEQTLAWRGHHRHKNQPETNSANRLYLGQLAVRHGEGEGQCWSRHASLSRTEASPLSERRTYQHHIVAWLCQFRKWTIYPLGIISLVLRTSLSRFIDCNATQCHYTTQKYHSMLHLWSHPTTDGVSDSISGCEPFRNAHHFKAVRSVRIVVKSTVRPWIN